MFNLGNSEILQIAESVAREKGINRDLVLHAMEQAIQVAGRKKYGHEHNILAEISRKNGEVKLWRVLTVVEEVEDSFTQIDLKDALERDANAKLEDEIYEPLPPIDLGRVAAQTAKQVIIQKVKDAERDKEYDDFKNRVGEILQGVVKRLEFGNIIVDIGRAEAIVNRDQVIPAEQFKINDRIKAYIADVRRENRGPQIFLSRTDNNFLLKLFENEVPEIYDGVIEVKAIARDPGSKAKIAVYSRDTNLDAVGACVGIRGSRVRGITSELHGEKIDVIEYSNDLSEFITNALSPAKISKVLFDETNNKVEVIVAEDQLSLAIGRRGQNVRLASQLTGFSLDVLTDEQESKRRSEEFSDKTNLFMHVLDVEEVIAQLLTVEGYNSIEQLANSSIETLTNIEGFDEDLSAELINRASNYIKTRNEEVLAELEQLGVQQDLLDMLNIDLESLLILAKSGVKNVEDLAELTAEEFIEILNDKSLDVEAVRSVIETAKNNTSEDSE